MALKPRQSRSVTVAPRGFFDFVGLPAALGNTLSDVKVKATEAASSVLGSFGGSGPFKKLGETGASLVTSAANQAFQYFGLKQTNSTMSDAEIEARIWAMSPPLEGTALDTVNATAMIQNAQSQDNITAGQANQAAARTEVDNSHKVRLVERGGLEVTFDVMPEVVESRTIEYEPVAPPQAPAAFQKYKGTSNVQWTVNATLTCRNKREATQNLKYLNILRGWTMPFFGERTRQVFPDKLGAPPPVLEFSGWREQMVGPVQVVITSLNWNFPQDVDYIPAEGFTVVNSNGTTVPTGKLIPFPTVIKLAIQLVESFSTDQINGFSLADFRAGQMATAWQPLARGASIGASTTSGAVEENTNAPSFSDARNGTWEPPPPAQIVQPSALNSRGVRSDVDPAQRVYAGLGQSVAGGRGVIVPPLVQPDRQSGTSSTTSSTITEVRRTVHISGEPEGTWGPDTFESGGGGDWGGAGASNDGDDW